VTRIGNSFLVTVIDVDRIRGKEAFLSDVDNLIAYVKSSKVAAGCDQIMVPGEPEALELVRRGTTYPNRGSLQKAHEQRGIIPANKTYGMMEWECHTPPEGGFNINVDGALRAARDAGAESMMFYSRSQGLRFLSQRCRRAPSETGKRLLW
jgi:hypothetical protein